MPERRHITDNGWQESQKRFAGRQTVERIEISRSRVQKLKTQLKDDLAYGLVLGAGLPAASIVLNLADYGSESLQRGTLILGIIMAAGSVIRFKEDEQASADWQEILSREIANSRISISQEDRTLTRAIYESELKVTSDDEMANMKLVLNYLRNKGILKDKQE